MTSGDTALHPIGLYERMGERTTQPFALRLLERLAPIKGEALIDIAAGTGGFAVTAAERGAHVLATDINPTMIERTAERLHPFSLCRAEVMDFHALAVNDASFNIAVSNFGILAYSTWQQGLTEMIRVTRSGGRIVLSMWTHRRDCAPAHVMQRVFSQAFPSRELWPNSLFPIFSEEQLAAIIQDAGCTDAAVEVIEESWSPYSSADVVSECDPMFRIFPGYAALQPHEVATLHEALGEAFKGYAGDDGIIRLPTKAFVVIARKS